MSGLTTDVEICNQAMILIGAQRISSLSAPSNPRERDLALIYPQARDSELRKNRWLFAKTEASIALDGSYTAPTDSQWAGRYQLPADCVRAHLPPSDGTLEVRGRYVYSQGDDDTLLLTYTKSTAVVGEFDANFADALAARIAYIAAEQLTQSSAKRQLALEHYKLAISEARRSNAIERQVDTVGNGYGWEWADING